MSHRAHHRRHPSLPSGYAQQIPPPAHPVSVSWMRPVRKRTGRVTTWPTRGVRLLVVQSRVCHSSYVPWPAAASCVAAQPPPCRRHHYGRRRLRVFVGSSVAVCLSVCLSVCFSFICCCLCCWLFLTVLLLREVVVERWSLVSDAIFLRV